MSDSSYREALKDLVAALDSAFISSWQSTAAWQKQLDSARELLEATAGSKGESHE